MDKKQIEPKVPVNRRKFFLTNTSNPEDHGFSREQVEDMLDIVANYDEHEAFNNPDFVNSIGTFFEDGVCIEKNIEQAVYWYERAVALGDDLAKSNLADVLRKGTLGYPKDLKRAFELYKSCRLPYAFYRLGEFYEYGWVGEKDLEKAKESYRIAYREDHALAKRKLKELDFLH